MPDSENCIAQKLRKRNWRENVRERIQRQKKTSNQKKGLEMPVNNGGI